MPTKENIDCIIIGAGPAGLAAAIQAKRQGLSVAVFERASPGGQAVAANLIENFPGFPEGISGTALMERFLKQAEGHGIKIKKSGVERIRKTSSGFEITADSKKIACNSVIIACGLTPKHMEVPGEENLIGKRIFYYSDPAAISHRGKRVVIIGSGDAAFDQALNFSRRAKKVTILMRGRTAGCISKLYRAALDAGVEIIKNTTVECFTTGCHSEPKAPASPELQRGEKNPIKSMGSFATFKDDNAGLRLVIGINVGKNKSAIETDLAIVCIGKERRIPFIDSKLAAKNTPGLFWAGDCLHGRHRHIAIAMGDGTLAAMKAAEFLCHSERSEESRGNIGILR